MNLVAILMLSFSAGKILILIELAGNAGKSSDVILKILNLKPSVCVDLSARIVVKKEIGSVETHGKS